MTEYEEFLETKRIVAEVSGFDVTPEYLNPTLYDFQAAVTRWALKRGRAAVWGGCGTGKSFIQAEWAQRVAEHEIGQVLIAAPLSVAPQTIREAAKMGIEIEYARKPTGARIQITNYEMLDNFAGHPYVGMVLDEASILKSIDGATRDKLIEDFTCIPYRLTCTATPCPNDISELANQCEFLGVMKRNEMLASFFVHDDEGYRLRGHAAKPFYRWLASWAMAFRSPADIGFDASRFVLPPLEIIDEVVITSWRKPGELFAGRLKGITDRADVRKTSAPDRVRHAVELIKKSWTENSNLNECAIGISETGNENSQRCGQSERQNGSQNAIVSGGSSIDLTRNQRLMQRETTTGTTSRKPRRKNSDSTGSLQKKRQSAPNSRETVAPFASGSSLETEEQTDCTLTMTIEPEKFEECFVAHAISDSVNSAMIPTPCDERPVTSKLTQWIVWCGTNSEQEGIVKALGSSCVSIDGSTSFEDKIALNDRWIRGDVAVMVTKCKIMGWGQNWQHVSNMLFLGLSDSYEAYYQAIRRCYRYGQKKPVRVHVVVTDHEVEIVENVRKKERESEDLINEIIDAAKGYEMEELGKLSQKGEEMATGIHRGQNWTVHQGDCVEVMGAMGESSIDLSVYSPPFIALYTYSASDKDMGNAKNHEEFFRQYAFAARGLLRITKPGRLTCCHVAQVPKTLVNDGVIGFRDFRGDTIKCYESAGWIYHGEVCIFKNPQAQSIRTHAKGLAFQQLKKDSSWLRPAMADYILVFRKPGDNAVPIHPDITNEDWINWASPIWMDINETDTLNTAEARSDEDDRHICPLQLGTIERCIRLWSNPGETVFSPFAGIGSEGYEAVRLGRKFIGSELKPLYCRTAARNLAQVEQESKIKIRTLFDVEPSSVAG